MAAIVLDGANHAKLKLTNSKIRKNGGYGLFRRKLRRTDRIYIQSGSKTTCAAAVALPANEVRKVNNMVATSFTGNGHDGIECMGHFLFVLDNEESVWPALGFGATYLVRGSRDRNWSEDITRRPRLNLPAGKDWLLSEMVT